MRRERKLSNLVFRKSLIKKSVTHADLQHEHRAKRLENDSHVGQNDHVFYANGNRECDK